MRIACLNAVKHVPSLGQKTTGDKSTVTTLLWMALHDPDKVNKEVNLDIFCAFLGFDYGMFVVQSFNVLFLTGRTVLW